MNTTGTSMAVIGSVDSGLGNEGMGHDSLGHDDMGHDGMEFMHGDGNGPGLLSERRSSSEEKESMTPAQSRRKAQNRAA
jgi:hypothetical protein